uniref:Secreted protein n=1 Tax=Sinocyclocheilus rhinocerous TaxID=307959 RepID=A0A673JAJ6_9TELE
MPIWSITCCQFICLILMIRSAIPFTSSKRSSGVLRIVEAMRAPFMDSTLFASSASAHTTVNPPTRSPTTNTQTQ